MRARVGLATCALAHGTGISDQQSARQRVATALASTSDAQRKALYEVIKHGAKVGVRVNVREIK